MENAEVRWVSVAMAKLKLESPQRTQKRQSLATKIFTVFATYEMRSLCFLIWSQRNECKAGISLAAHALAIGIVASLVIASLADMGLATSSYFPVPLDPIANRPLVDFIQPPSGDIRLGEVLFHLDREFGTQQRFLLDNPIQGIIYVNITSPLKIYVLLHGGYVGKEFLGKEVGYFEMKFDDGSSFKKSIIAGKDLREGWTYDVPDGKSISYIEGNPNWQNVWSETQSRGDKPAMAFIDMLTIPVPQEYQSHILTSISIYDSSIESVGSNDPSLIVQGITVEYMPVDSISNPTPIPTKKSEIQTPMLTKTPLQVTPTLYATPPPPNKPETNWLMIGGAGVLVLLGLIAFSKLRTKEEKEFKTPSKTQIPKATSTFQEKVITRPTKESLYEKLELKGTINVKSAFEYKGATIIFKIKLENNTSDPISDIKVYPYVPDVFLIKEKEKSIALIEPKSSQTVTFEIRPTGECGDCNVSGRINYYDMVLRKRHDIELESKSLSIVCPMLHGKEISEADWHDTVNNLVKTEESTREIEMPAESLFTMVSRIIKDMHMYMQKPEITQSQQLFNGVTRFYGEGVKGLRYAAQVEVVGGTKKSKLILKAWAEKEDALTGFYHGILDEIEKRINVKGYINDSIVQFNVHIGDKIGTQVKDSFVQRSNIGARKCPTCGREVDANEKFCMDCGVRL